MFVFDVVYVVLGAFFVWMFYDVVSGIKKDWSEIQSGTKRKEPTNG